MGWSHGYLPMDKITNIAGDDAHKATNVLICVPIDMDDKIITSESAHLQMEIVQLNGSLENRQRLVELISVASTAPEPLWDIFPDDLWNALCENYPEFAPIAILYS